MRVNEVGTTISDSAENGLAFLIYCNRAIQGLEPEHMEFTQSTTTPIELSCYSVEALLLKAGIHSQQKVFARIEGRVRVKGVVTKVNRYKTAA